MPSKHSNLELHFSKILNILNVRKYRISVFSKSKKKHLKFKIFQNIIIQLILH